MRFASANDFVWPYCLKNAEAPPLRKGLSSCLDTLAIATIVSLRDRFRLINFIFFVATSETAAAPPTANNKAMTSSFPQTAAGSGVITASPYKDALDVRLSKIQQVAAPSPNSNGTGSPSNGQIAPPASTRCPPDGAASVTDSKSAKCSPTVNQQSQQPVSVPSVRKTLPLFDVLI